MKFLILSLSFLISTQSFAIRHVGNAGGDAEMKLLDYHDDLKYWVKACTENLKECSNKPKQAAQVLKTVSNYLDKQVVTSVDFYSQNLAQAPNFCSNHVLYVQNESLYVDGKLEKEFAKSNVEIFEVMIERILGCMDQPAAVKHLFKFIAQAQTHYIYPVVELKFQDGGSLLSYVSQEENLHQEITQGKACKEYSVTIRLQEGYVIKCKGQDTQQRFLLFETDSEGKVRSYLRFFAD